MQEDFYFLFLFSLFSGYSIDCAQLSHVENSFVMACCGDDGDRDVPRHERDGTLGCFTCFLNLRFVEGIYVYLNARFEHSTLILQAKNWRREKRHEFRRIESFPFFPILQLCTLLLFLFVGPAVIRPFPPSLRFPFRSGECCDCYIWDLHSVNTILNWIKFSRERKIAGC